MTLERLFGAILSGAFAGAAVVASFVAGLLLITRNEGAPGTLFHAIGNLALFTGMSFLIAFGAFAIGIAILGLPVWWGLHKLGWRRRLHAVLAGVVLAGFSGVALATISDVSIGMALAGFAQMALPGAAAGWTLHRVAYGSNPKA